MHKHSTATHEMNRTSQIGFACALAALAALAPYRTMALSPEPVDLGTSAPFVILAGSAITSTGGGDIHGDVGLSPATGANITGLVQAQVDGTIYTVDGTGPTGNVMDPDRLSAAKDDLTTAYNDAAIRPRDVLDLGGGEIGGEDLAAGVYRFSSSAAISSHVTLTGGPNDVWIFQIGSTLTVGSGVHVVLADGAAARNVFWQVGSSATLHTFSDFKGTIMADQSITINTSSMIEGRALAINAAVTFDGALLNEPLEPTLAVITALRSRVEDGVAVISWAVDLEIDTVGYYLERWVNGAWGRVNATLIRADPFAPVPKRYEQADPGAPLGTTQRYRVVELDYRGRLPAYGPYDLELAGADSAATDPDGDALAGFQAAGVVTLAESVPLTGPAAKVLVRSNDVYAVSVEAVAALLGVDPVTLAGLAEQAWLQMHGGGEPVAYHYDPADGVLLFYGEGRKTRYARDAVYWIEPGPGLHIVREAPLAIPVSTAQTFHAFIDFEQDLVSMVEHSGNLREDLYFWTHIFSGDATIGERAFAVPLEGYASGDVAVTVRLTGWSDTPVNPDHLAEIRFNGNLIGAFTFDGKEDAEATFTAPSAMVLPSGNALRIKGVLQPGVVSSIFVVNGFATAYEQYYTPRSGLLEAGDGGNARIAPASFTNPLAWNVTDPRTPVRIALDDGSLPAGLSWETGAGGDRWILRERSGHPLLVPVAAGHGTWLLAETNRLDYLVIAPRAFNAPAQLLADYRASLGLRSAVATYEDICDQFADGVSTPEAIRTFLQYAHQHWAEWPRLVVLGGWGHHDYYGALTTEPNYLPALLGSDSATLRPSDGLFADLTGDGNPELAVGRLPAQSVTQFYQVISKLQDYEAMGPNASHGQAFFAADNEDGGGDFHASNTNMAAVAGNRYAVSFTTLDTQTVTAVRAHIRAALTNGVGVLHYTGHGSYRQLAAENLLHYDTVVALSHPPVPLFLSLTCLIGRFDLYLPGQRSLAEGLVMNPHGGALAAYAPAGLSWNNYSEQFGVDFYEQHAVEAVSTIGLALQQTRRAQQIVSSLHADSLRTYNLLGDPALKLQGGAGVVPAAWIETAALWRWETFSYAALADPANDLAWAEELFAERLVLRSEGAVHSLAGGDGAFEVWSVDTWEAVSEVAWISLTGTPAGAYSGRVAYAVAPNEGAARSGPITVSGGGTSRVFRVSQASAFSPADGEEVNEWQPRFAWPSVSGATWYQLWINRDGRTYWTPWVQTETQWVPTVALPPGSYAWWVRGWNSSSGYGVWSRRNAFTIPVRIPGVIELLAPAGAQSSNTVEFLWRNDADATWYRLWVSHPTGGIWHDRWVQLVGGEEGQVAVGGHPGGTSVWWLRPWGPHGTGPWSGPVSFTTPDPAPAKPTLIAPLGSTSTPVTLQYSSDRAQWFRIYVSRGGTVEVDQWTTAATFDAGTMSRGSYAWWVGGWNDVTRTVVWSARGDFTIP